MALNNHVEKFTLDMAPGGIAPVLNVSQGDIGRKFTADIFWGGSSYDVSGLTAKVRGRKRDNTVFEYVASLSGTTATFETKKQMTIIPGNVDCEIVFFDSSSHEVGTANFTMIVEEAPYDPDAPSQSVVPGIEDLIEEVLGGEVAPAVDEWLDAHPEATTTVQDGAVTREKLADNITDFLPLEYTKTRYTGTAGTTTVWYAIIPAEYKPRLVLANDTVNTVEEPQKLGGRETATIAVNAGIFNMATSETRGYIINNGEVIKDTNYTAGSSSQYLYMEADGTLKAVPENITIEQLSALNPVWAVHGWYPIVQDGQDLSGGRDNTDGAPRTFVGQDTDGNYIVFVASGRMDNEAGFSIKDGVDFCPTVGFTPYFLYNLDGGGSSAFVYKGVRVSELVEGENRPVANFLVWGKDPAKLPDAVAAASVASGENIDVQKYLYENVYSVMKLPRLVGSAVEQGVQETASDLNTLFKGGIYKISSTMNGSPLSDYGFLLVVRDNNKMINQVAFNKDELFIRQLWLNNDNVSATASSWVQYSKSVSALDLSGLETAPTIEYNQLKKDGSVVSMELSITLNAAIADYGKIGTIPVGFRNNRFIYFYAFNGTNPVVCYLAANGELHFRKSGGLAVGDKLQVIFTYII